MCSLHCGTYKDDFQLLSSQQKSWRLQQNDKNRRKVTQVDTAQT